MFHLINLFQSSDDANPPVNQNGKVLPEITNGTIVNNNKRKSEPDIDVILEEDEDTSVSENNSQISIKKTDSKKDKQKRISFRGNKKGFFKKNLSRFIYFK